MLLCDFLYLGLLILINYLSYEYFVYFPFKRKSCKWFEL